MSSPVLRMVLVVVGFAMCQSAAAAPSSVSAQIVYHTVFFEGDSPPWEDLPIHISSNLADLAKTIPFQSGKFAMVELRCAGLSAERHLLGCKIRAEPTDPGYKRAGQKLIRDLTIDSAYGLSGKPKVKFISIQLRLSNSEVDANHGPCWPPSCSFVPPPPPAPQSGN